ncbi:MAG: hypothetical protein IJM54_00100 [Thermoguttaceae bacterium]|nr:hypothetical protein [Thermoguttaceae bacterium]MBR4750294.1 hypothetical protein [Thermoguttaceae bacterium]MBR5757004.1 hypothetical protein [Thermoguttaceae bacterium]
MNNFLLFAQETATPTETTTHEVQPVDARDLAADGVKGAYNMVKPLISIIVLLIIAKVLMDVFGPKPKGKR